MLVVHEWRNLTASRALWLTAAVVAVLVGYGYIQAVALFAEASRTARDHAELARGMTPLDGILVPTFGAFYLAVTLLFPFVAIRALANEKQSGALKLALQLSRSPYELVAAKTVAIGGAWVIALAPALLAVALWRAAGGHADPLELGNLLLGHALYGWVVTGIAMLAAAIADAAPTAAIVTLAFTLGFWVLDFAASSGAEGPFASLAQLSLTAALRAFEQGLFSLPYALGMTAGGLALLAAAAQWLRSDRTPGARTVWLAGVGVLAGLALGAVAHAQLYRDLSEDRRNSFNPADEAALRAMRAGLVITVHLSPDDSRRKEMDANVFAKLRRFVPRIAVRYEAPRHGMLSGGGGDERYGIVVYEYAGRRAESRSNSPREILPLLHELAGVQVKPIQVPDYPGHPLVTDASRSGWLFYLLLPVAAAWAAWWSRRPRRHPVQPKEVP